MQRQVKQRSIPEVSLDGVSPVLQRIFAARGISSSQQLQHGLDQLLPYNSMLNIEAAAQRLFMAIRNQQRVLILGDYDADGATSCAVAIRALRMLGLEQVDYLVPSRFKFGYGLSAEIVAVAREFKPDLIVTVDNGIASVAGVKAAREAGIDVVITDHHLPGKELPEANVIVNPNQTGDVFASKALAGVGVVFYLMLALRACMREANWFAQHQQSMPNLAELLDIVALGTVADVVPLDHNNRILIEQGLRRIRAGKAHAGIVALIQIARRDYRYISATDLAFAIAPRLNAAGRLEDMSLGIECLLTDDQDSAVTLATELDNINHERRAISRDMEDEAETMLQQLHLSEASDALPVCYCLYQPHWHQGVSGILAGRIKDRTHRPSIVFAKGEQGELKGSARSIPGFHIRDAMEAVAAGNPGLIAKFGGHAMAAGLTIAEADFELFAQCFNEYAENVMDEDVLMQCIHTDGQLTQGELSMLTAQQIEQAGPWGQEFPEPLFEGRFVVLEQRRIGADQRHLKLRLGYDNIEIDAVAFNQPEDSMLEGNDQVSITYRMAVNRYRGFENLQIVVNDVLENQINPS